MKVLIVGSGGREHAIILKLRQSKKVSEIYCARGNGGISKHAKCITVPSTDIPGMVDFAVEENIDFVVVAPDNPLVAGMVDAFEEAGIKTFGPNKAAAILEGSKIFSKQLMQRYNIPTAEYKTFDDPGKAVDYIESKNTFPTVIKTDGLAFGKGVIIAQNLDEAKKAISSIMEDKIFGESGNNIIVEEFLYGPEVSVLAFTDGKTIKPMVSSMDHKRAYDGNTGPNTGGMGTVAPNPYYTTDIAKQCMDTIFVPTIKAMQAEGRPFKGCLFFGLMLTQKGPKVIEYNCRFGDPEAQVVLQLLKTDLMDIFEAIYDERLDEIDVEFSNEHAACVIMASGGYPGKFDFGFEVTGLDENGQRPGITIYHAGTWLEGGFKTFRGRVIGVTATGKTLKDAIDKCYDNVSKIHFDNVHYRTDIGKLALEAYSSKQR